MPYSGASVPGPAVVQIAGAIDSRMEVFGDSQQKFIGVLAGVGIHTRHGRIRDASRLEPEVRNAAHVRSCSGTPRS